MSKTYHDPINRTANRPHICNSCYESISIGKKYIEQTGIEFREFFRNRYHPKCYEYLYKSNIIPFIPPF